jgi:signal transduction histidine kinase
MAWYTGVIAGRQRWLVPIVGWLGALALLLLVIVNPIPSYEQFLAQATPPNFSLFGIPEALLVYPIYSLLCVVLALLALWQPAASERFMGDLARRRARPWLIAASLVLLLVIAAVGLAAAWFLFGVQSGRLNPFSYQALLILHVFDLLVAGLIAIAVVLIGNALVSYEVFTGKTLPRGGLRRYWRNSLVLAAGYGSLLAWSLDLPVDAIYRLMLATVLMTLFYALLSWRSYVERERSIERLRPFVASQHMYDSMVEPSAGAADDVGTPLRALCQDVLDARVAFLVPLGPLAPLVGPVVYGGAPGLLPAPNAISILAARFISPHDICVPLDPALYGGAVWAVPLWSERGLVGALLLGEKRGAAMYTQEEIEIARAAGERLIDTSASAELARRIVGLQRQRLAESQVVDHRTRRVLHDDVLPQLHTAMLLLQSGASQAGADDVVALLADAHHRIADLLHALPTAPGTELVRRGLLGGLRHSLATEYAGVFDAVRWHADATAEQRAHNLPVIVAEVLFFAAREAVRNAARYGRGDQPGRPLHLSLHAHTGQGAANGFVLVVEDDGVGIESRQLPSAGVGRGLALHSTLLAVVGGSLSVESEEGAYTRVSLWIPEETLVQHHDSHAVTSPANPADHHAALPPERSAAPAP